MLSEAVVLGGIIIAGTALAMAGNGGAGFGCALLSFAAENPWIRAGVGLLRSTD
jgi:hypothetical protein